MVNLIALIILTGILRIAFLFGRMAERKKANKEMHKLNRDWSEFSKQLIDDTLNK